MTRRTHAIIDLLVIVICLLLMSLTGCSTNDVMKMSGGEPHQPDKSSPYFFERHPNFPLTGFSAIHEGFKQFGETGQ
jgi:hypothetical protein